MGLEQQRCWGSQRGLTSNKGFSLRTSALGLEQTASKQSYHWSEINCLCPNTHITLPSWNSPIKDKLWQAFKHTGKLSLSLQWDNISLAPGPPLACRASLCKFESDVLWVGLLHTVSGPIVGHCAWHIECRPDFSLLPSLSACVFTECSSLKLHL